MSVFDELFAPPAVDTLPSERALFLRNGLIDAATGGSMQESSYKALRDEFIAEPETRELLPTFVRTCYNPADFWSFIKAEFALTQNDAHIYVMPFHLCSHSLNKGEHLQQR